MDSFVLSTSSGLLLYVYCKAPKCQEGWGLESRSREERKPTRSIALPVSTYLLSTKVAGSIGRTRGGM